MAGLFGNIMAEIFAWQPDEWEASLRKIGFFLGKFIYLMDAYEDVEKDIASGSYNPLKEAFANDSDFAGNCRGLLTLMMAECSRNSRSFANSSACGDPAKRLIFRASGAAIRQLPPQAAGISKRRYWLQRSAEM
ncbi:MAG: DUF5685 family protein [[Clostridium] scindens]